MTKPGHELPNFDNRGYAEGTLFGQAAQNETTEQPEQPAEAIESAPVKPVSEILEDIERRKAEKAQRWQELTDSNWPPGRIEEKLDAEFPELIPVERQFEEERRRETAERRHAQALHGPKRQRSRKLRNTRNPRDTGPPPHIAEDVRRAQGLIE